MPHVTAKYRLNHVRVVRRLDTPPHNPRTTPKRNQQMIGRILNALVGNKRKYRKYRKPYRRNNKAYYNNYMNSPNWKVKRQKIMKKAGYKCRQCGARAVNVHHETYRRLGNERDTDLTALCRNCHRRKH